MSQTLRGYIKISVQWTYSIYTDISFAFNLYGQGRLIQSMATGLIQPMATGY